MKIKLIEFMLSLNIMKVILMEEFLVGKSNNYKLD